MIKYHQDRIDFASLKENNIDRKQLAMIPEGSRVLEIGCATGYMGEYLVRDRRCDVLGVEPEAEQAEAARRRGLEVITGSIGEAATARLLDAHVRERGGFGVIFMSQVIEHLAWPDRVLRLLPRWLARDGCLVISTCSVVHWTIRLQVLRGRWQYQDYGILDNSHLRFFTIDSLRRLLESCGYRCVEFDYTFEDLCPFKILFDTRILAPSDILRLIPVVGMRLRRAYTDLFRNLLATQFVYRAVVADRQPDNRR